MKILLSHLRLMVFLLSLLSLEAYNAQGQGSQVRLGSGDWQINGDVLNIQVSEVVNDSSEPSGSLRLRVFATSAPYNGTGTLTGYELGVYSLQPLDGGYSYNDLSVNVGYTAPPDGTYYTVMTVEEYTDSGWVIDDYINFDGTSNFGGTGGGGTGDGGDNNPPLHFSGYIDWSLNASTLTITAAEVDNDNPDGISGTLRLEVFATSAPFDGGSLYGYSLGTYVLGQLDGGLSFYNISGNTSYTPPPEGTYYTVVALEEYRGSGYVIVDYLNMNGTYFLGAPGVGGGTPGGSGGPAVVQLQGNVGWSINGNVIQIDAGAIANTSSSGTSGTLRLRVWATSAPFSGGTLTGSVIGSDTLGTLRAGSSFKNVAAKTTYTPPLAGTYYTVVTVEEYTTSGWNIDSYANMSTTSTLGTSPAGGGGGGGGSGFSNISLQGPVSWSANAGVLKILAGSLANDSASGTSGTLRLRVWATSAPFTGGTLTGNVLGAYTLKTLKAGSAINNLDVSTAYTPPPGGTYYTVVTVEEYTSSGYVIDAYRNMDGTSYFDGGSGGGLGLALVGVASYNITAKNVDLNVTEIANNRSSGVSGSLLLRLWATQSVYSGGTINGDVLAYAKLDPLKAGYHYSNLNKKLPYYPPPSGTYYLTLTLEEYNNGTYYIMDYIDFPNQFTR